MTDFSEKIRKIEAIIARSKSDGELQAARLAKERLLSKESSRPVEYTIRLHSRWEKRLFVALCQKFQLKTYRYKRQKYTTAMLFVDSTFMNEILWPEFKKYSNLFQELVQQVIEDLISQIHQVADEEEIIIAGEISTSIQVVDE